MNFNRRKFLYYSSFSSLSLALGSCNSGKQNSSVVKTTSSKKKLGVALVGLGNYSTSILAPALQLTQHCELRGIATGTPRKIPSWQEKYGIKDSNIYSYDNLHEIANNDEIDVVYVVVPTGLHSKYSIIAANAGKHVWCEKPMALNVEQCQQIINACEKNKVKLSIAYRMQHEPNTQTVIEYAQSKPYGAFTKITAMAGYSGRPSLEQPNTNYGKNWRLRKALGGGALYDMGVYTINGMRYSTDLMPLKVLQATQTSIREEFFDEVDETTEYQLLFPGGLIGYGKTSVGESFRNMLRVDAEKGWYELSPMQSYSGVGGKTSDGILLNKPIESQQAKQMDDDAQAILNNQSVLVPGNEGLIDVGIINAIMESAAKGTEVEIGA